MKYDLYHEWAGPKTRWMDNVFPPGDLWFQILTRIVQLYTNCIDMATVEGGGGGYI